MHAGSGFLVAHLVGSVSSLGNGGLRSRRLSLGGSTNLRRPVDLDILSSVDAKVMVGGFILFEQQKLMMTYIYRLVFLFMSIFMVIFPLKTRHRVSFAKITVTNSKRPPSTTGQNYIISFVVFENTAKILFQQRSLNLKPRNEEDN